MTAREVFLADLAACLRGPRRRRRRLLGEIGAHLADAVSAELAGGASSTDAEARALERLGGAELIARRYAAERAVLRGARRRRVAAVALAGAAAGALAMTQYAAGKSQPRSQHRAPTAGATASRLLVPAARASVYPLFQRASARVGERVAVDCGYVGLHPGDVVLYLIKLSDVPRVFAVSRTTGLIAFDGRPPRDRRLHGLGACRIGQQGNGRLSFTVPRVTPGRYTLVVWCKTCRKGGDHWYIASPLWGDAPGTVLRVRTKGSER